jgi:SAM-dependent methyltransferase
MALTAQEFIDGWPRATKNRDAVVALWDSMAKDYSPEAVSFEDDPSLGILKRNGMFGPGSRVLDVGCGSGSYAFALAPRCAEVVGIDISPRMIGLAREHAQAAKVGNASFECAEWREAGLEGVGYAGAFDLVIAHMTPAVQDSGSFEKLSAASRAWCAWAKPIRRIDPVSDRARSIVGMGAGPGGDDGIVNAFAVLYLRGLEPRIEYWPESWTHRKTVDEARDLYVNRMRTMRDITDEEEGKVMDYLRSIAVDGIIAETVEMTAATLYWHI